MRAKDAAVDAEPLDLVVVGAGPCGLAAAVAAKEAGLAYVVLDRGCITESLTHYPYYMTFFSTAERLEIGGVPFTIPEAKPTRREALAYYRRVVAHHGLSVRQYEEVTGVEAAPVVGQKTAKVADKGGTGTVVGQKRGKVADKSGGNDGEPAGSDFRRPQPQRATGGESLGCTRAPS